MAVSTNKRKFWIRTELGVGLMLAIGWWVHVDIQRAVASPNEDNLYAILSRTNTLGNRTIESFTKVLDQAGFDFNDPILQSKENGEQKYSMVTIQRGNRHVHQIYLTVREGKVVRASP